MELNAANWTNCAMCVQDITLPGKNITAEISKQQAANFVNMCRIFSSYTPKFKTKTQPTANIQQEAIFLENMKKRINFQELCRKLDDDFNSSMLSRCHHDISEAVIFAQLTLYVQAIYPSLKLHLFGSRQYGLRSKTSNLNLLVETG